MIKMKNNKQFDIPVVMIVFKRLDLTKRVFESIRQLKPLKLYIIADGPRNDEEKKEVQAVREYLDKNIDWACEVHRNYAEHNLGLRYRMPSGTNWVFETEEKAIFIEDDILASQDFFWFCKQMLEEYEKDERIMMVSGTNLYAGSDTFGDGDIIFSNFSTIWGWATWKRAWEKYDVNIRKWPQVRKEKILKDILSKKGYRFYKTVFNDLQFHWYRTWDYQWEFTKFANRGLGIIPKCNLINNLGMGNENAEHRNDLPEKIDFVSGVQITSLRLPVQIPSDVVVNKEYDEMFQNHFVPSISTGVYLKNNIRAFFYNKFLRTIKKMEKDTFYFKNILPEKYKLTEEEQSLNIGDFYKYISAKEFRKSAIAYPLYKWFRIDLY